MESKGPSKPDSVAHSEALQKAMILLQIVIPSEIDIQKGKALPHDQALIRVRSRLKV